MCICGQFPYSKNFLNLLIDSITFLDFFVFKAYNDVFCCNDSFKFYNLNFHTFYSYISLVLGHSVLCSVKEIRAEIISFLIAEVELLIFHH